MNVQNVPPWFGVTPSMTSGSLHRSAKEYVQVIEQFNVQGNSRYKWEEGKTYCNKYVEDCTTALGCRIPGVIEAGIGNRPQALNANDMLDWMRVHGRTNGWQGIDKQEVNSYTSVGMPVVAMMSGKIGHVAMCLPPIDKLPGVVMISQAGARNFHNEPIFDGFGADIGRVQFWAHH